MNKCIILLALISALAGCAGPSERFLLLPQADGSASSIVVKTATGQTALDTPYASVETSRGKIDKPQVLSKPIQATELVDAMLALLHRPARVH